MSMLYVLEEYITITKQWSRDLPKKPWTASVTLNGVTYTATHEKKRVAIELVKDQLEPQILLKSFLAKKEVGK